MVQLIGVDPSRQLKGGIGCLVDGRASGCRHTKKIEISQGVNLRIE